MAPPTGAHSETSANAHPSLLARTFSDPNHLAPEDAFYAHSPPRRRREPVPGSNSLANGADVAVPSARTVSATRSRRTREKERGRSASRRRKGVWKKLLWVKQSCTTPVLWRCLQLSGVFVEFILIAYGDTDPDNYTDEETFLDHLQRNPRLQPYDFWPLVADSTVIVQHVCSVIIFVCCFVGIFQERISPVSVVSWGSFGTVLGWGLWDWWVGQEEAARAMLEASSETADHGSSASSVTSSNNVSGSQGKEGVGLGLGLTLMTTSLPARHDHSYSGSATSTHSNYSGLSPVTSGHPTGAANFANYSYFPPYGAPASPFSPRNQQRLATAKSAILIYCALLGLSPILKSLTKSTTSDSIWAMSCWLMSINVFFFDYGGGVGVK